MVTDGLETCDADPAAIAGDLRSSEAGVTTHVIGFGTTPEEQTILSGIAEAGEGQLLGSDNTGQLLSALFEVLEELDVVEETGTGESRNSPLGVGRIGRVGDFDLSVISVTPNANDIVATENEFNELPTEGNQFFLVTISATYVGAASGNPSFDLDYQAVGASSSGYTTYNNTCGVVPNDLYNVTDQFSGGTAEFNICWQVEGADEDSLVMYVESFLNFNSSPVWFSLGNPIEETVDSESTPAPTVQATVAPIAPTAATDVGDSPSLPRGDSSRENPLAVGEVGVVDDYEIGVLSVTPNADEIVLADDISEPPAAGNQYFMVNISVTYVGSTSGEPAFDLNPQAVGALSTSYTTFNNQCGFGTFDKNYILATELFEGGSADYNVCWQIASEDADSLVMYIESNVDFNIDPVWFELQP